MVNINHQNPSGKAGEALGKTGTPIQWSLPIKGNPHVISLDGLWRVSPDQDNLLVLNEWTLTIPSLQIELAARPMPLSNQLAGLKVDPVFPLQVVYHCEFQARALPEGLYLLLDADALAGDAQIYLNDLCLEPQDFLPRRIYDMTNRAMEIRKGLRIGANRLEVRLTVAHESQGLLDSIKLVGRFEVELIEGGCAMVAPAPEHGLLPFEQIGYPFYCGSLSFAREVDLTASQLKEGIVIDLARHWAGFKNVARILVNGREAALRPWPPYAVDVMRFTREGLNQLEIQIIGTLAGIL